MSAATSNSFSRRSTYLVVSLVLLLVVHPFLLHSMPGRFVLGLLAAGIPLAAVFALANNRRLMGVASVLGAASFVGNLHLLLELELLPLGGASPLLGLLFCGFVATTVIRHIVESESVTTETLRAAAAGYLLIGFTFMFAYVLIESSLPGSFQFNVPNDAHNPLWSSLTYFSFVTLTTLGYGDIVPVSPVARSVAALEAITGVLYIAVLISRLVGAFRAPR